MCARERARESLWYHTEAPRLQSHSLSVVWSHVSLPNPDSTLMYSKHSYKHTHLPYPCSSWNIFMFPLTVYNWRQSIYCEQLFLFQANKVRCARSVSVLSFLRGWADTTIHNHVIVLLLFYILSLSLWLISVFCLLLSDMLFLQGSEVIFKVALSLLGSHKPLILQHDSLESIVEFIKTTLPNLGLVQMEKTINQVR